MKTHSQVIENFIRQGVGGKGTYVKASDDLLYSRVPENYRPYGHRPWGGSAAGTEAPLAVRLEDGGILANGARLANPMDNYQWDVLKALEKSRSRFGVIPFPLDCRCMDGWTGGRLGQKANSYPGPETGSCDRRIERRRALARGG